MKNHLKKIIVPPTWNVEKKGGRYVTHPNPGGHSLEFTLPLGSIIRDELELTTTMTETRRLLRQNKVLVDGKRRIDPAFGVGLFDVLSLPEDHHYRISLDGKGRLCLVKITAAESKLKVCKIIGKKMLEGKKTQLNLHDGKNILSEVKAVVGEGVLVTLPEFTIKEVLPIKAGAPIFLTQGKHSGDLGNFKEIKGEEVVYAKGSEDIFTSKKYLFVVGKDKPLITLQNKE